jgi:hypothetical protein
VKNTTLSIRLWHNWFSAVHLLLARESILISSST